MCYKGRSRVLTWAGRPPPGRFHDEDAKMGRVGLDPPSGRGLAVRWGTGHSTDRESVPRADSRVTRTTTFSGADGPGWGNWSEDKGQLTAGP